MQDTFVLDSNLVCHETSNAQSTNLFFKCKAVRSIFNSEKGHGFKEMSLCILFFFNLTKAEFMQLVPALVQI